MLPINQKWYQKLLLLSLVLGVMGAIMAFVYTFVTDAGIELFFGGVGTDWWSGRWWWIPLTAFGGFLVGQMKVSWKVPESVPGGVALIGKGWIEPSLTLKLLTIAVVSAIFGASLGPFFGLIVMGGGLGSWMASKLRNKSVDVRQAYMLTGTAGTAGASFSAPLFGAVMTSELSPTKKVNYTSAFIPQIIAAVIGGTLYFSITNSTLAGSFLLPPFEYNHSQLLLAVALGLVGSVVLFVFAAITKLVSKLVLQMSDLRVRGAVGGAAVGLIVVALPLTAGSGIGQLATVLETPADYSITFLLMVLIAKMFAVSISLESGFLGGNVFPIMFIGAVSGVIIHLLFPAIPLSLAVATMLAAVPGAYLNAPLTLILVAMGTVGLFATSAIPIAIAYAIAHLTTSALQSLLTPKPTTAANP